MTTALRSRIDTLFATKVAELGGSPEFEGLVRGTATATDYDRFIEGVMRTHLRSPQLVAFLYALAPPAVLDHLLANLLEELGRDEPSGIAHPALLRELAIGAGLGSQLPTLETEATAELTRLIVEPLLYGTLRDVGLAALGEIVAFEYMLARVAGPVARALGRHLSLDPGAVAWFTHHAEVDRGHAAEGLAALEAHVAHYGVPEEDALTILELALSPNPFLKRYFGVVGRPIGRPIGRSTERPAGLRRAVAEGAS